eukprot:UN12969
MSKFLSGVTDCSFLISWDPLVKNCPQVAETKLSDGEISDGEKSQYWVL